MTKKQHVFGRHDDDKDVKPQIVKEHIKKPINMFDIM